MYQLDSYHICFFINSLKNLTAAFNILDYVSFTTSITRSLSHNKSMTGEFLFQKTTQTLEIFTYTIDLSLPINVIKNKVRNICDWILEKRSKSHIRSFEINGFKEFKPTELSKDNKHAYEIYTKDASICYLSDHFQYM